METTRPRPGSKETPEGMRLITKVPGQRKERGTERLKDGAEWKAREGVLHYLPRTAALKKSSLIEVELKKLTEGRYSLMADLHLTQRKLKRVKRKLKKMELRTGGI